MIDIAEETTQLKIAYDPYAGVPRRAHPTDAGVDLIAPRPFRVPARDEASIDFGVHIEIPDGWCGLILPKSGLNFKEHVAPIVGVIDAGYTGSIRAVVENRSKRDKIFLTGDKVCQLVIVPCLLYTFKHVDSLDDTERGDSGFGSTGR